MAELKMPNINQVGLSGRLCQDPESRISENGKLRVTFSIAVNFNYRDSLGEWKQDATFVPVVVWDKLAEAVSEHLRKGSGVFLTGRLRSRTFETGEGSRTILEVVARNIQFLDKKPKEDETPEADLDSEGMPF
jgi:single-strand DNA-binding protein